MQFLQGLFGEAPRDGSLGGAAAPGASLLTGGRGSTSFQVGELVDYSSSDRGWVPAKVVKDNRNGTFDLDCKPKVPLEKLRKRGGALAFKAGEMIECYSDSKRIWIPAKVVKANSNGTYDLDCKPNVPGDKVRQGKGYGSNSYVPSVAGSFVPAPRGISGEGRTKPNPFKTPVQLLSVKKSGSQWQYEVNSEGAKALESYGNMPIAVASICGPARTGKSFLLNLMLERAQKGLPLFKIGAAGKACTEGLWICGSVDESDRNRPCLVAFMDSAGMQPSGDGDAKRDAQLIAFSALLSSVVVMNTTGKLDDGVFQSISQSFAKLSSLVDDQGNEATRPLLNWVLRDFPMAELTDRSGKLMVQPEQYLEKALQSSGGQQVGQSLKDLFGNRKCTMLLPPTSDDKQLQNLASLPYARLRPEFSKGLEALAKELKGNCKDNPKKIGGSLLSCTAFVALARQLADMLNKPEKLHISRAWGVAQRTACTAVKQELMDSANSSLKPLAKGLGAGVKVSMKVMNVDYDRLRKNRKLKSAFKATLKESIADKAGHGIRPESVWVTLTGGSVVVNASIATPTSVQPSDVQGALNTALKSLPQVVASELQNLPDIASIMTHSSGSIKVESLTVEKADVQVLPMADEALHSLVQFHRQGLQSKWNEKSVGDEATKKENWSHLETSVNQMEKELKSKNVTLAREFLTKALLPWDAWVNSESPWADGARILDDLGHTMNRMPSQVLWKNFKPSFESVAQKLAEVRSNHKEAIASAASHKSQVVMLGDSFVGTEAEMERMKKLLARAEESEQRTSMRLQNLLDEFEDSKYQLQVVLGDIEAANHREQETRSQFNRFDEAEMSLRRELDDTLTSLSRLDAEHANLRASHEIAVGDKMRLEVDLDHYRSTAEKSIADRVRLERDHEMHLDEIRGTHRSDLNNSVSHHQQALDAAQRLHRDDLNRVERDYDVVVTETMSLAHMGENALPVKSHRGLQVGQHIIIAEGTAMEERNELVFLGEGPPGLKYPLQNSHGNGTKVSVVPAPARFAEALSGRFYVIQIVPPYPDRVDGQTFPDHATARAVFEEAERSQDFATMLMDDRGEELAYSGDRGGGRVEQMQAWWRQNREVAPLETGIGPSSAVEHEWKARAEKFETLLKESEAKYRVLESESQLSYQLSQHTHVPINTLNEKIGEATKKSEEELAQKQEQLKQELAADYEKRLDEQRGDFSRTRTENVQRDVERLSEEKKRFEEFQKEHSDSRKEDRERLLTRERESAKIFGEAQILQEQKARLQEKVEELEAKVLEGEASRGAGEGMKERLEQLQRELEQERETLRTERYERKVADDKKRPKKGCCFIRT